MKIISIDDLLRELDKHNHKELHNHHTWKPTHQSFNGKNHIQLQDSMKNHHVNVNGWNDIGQHITVMPDGKIVTGRDFGTNPASMTGYNNNVFMMEILGNFDIKGTGEYNNQGYDKLEGKQKETVLAINKYFIDRKGEKSIIFHRERSNKTCPGTGINKEQLINEAKGVKINMVIKLGSRGNDVKDLQTKLNKLGFNVGYADGIAGQNTIEGIKAFQRANGLTVDGLFGSGSNAVLDKLLNKPMGHWAKKHYDSLNAKGLNISQERFDDHITRGETFALLDDLVKKKMI